MASENNVVRVQQGQLRGVNEQSVYGSLYVAFRGIPYAKPPVGPLRFKDPEPPEPWTGVKDASNYGTSCAQIEAISRHLLGSDDCLYLNVYKPKSQSDEKLPVMVWIHGGAFVNGCGDSLVYGPDFLIEQDIVLVTINYRLGVLGFMNLEHEVAPGNQGLKDQVMALKWVKENIANFGGDPNNITIFGESAGASSVHYLTISPLSQGLFHKAISQSSVAVNPWAFVGQGSRKSAFRLAAKLGEHSTDPKTVIEFFRTVEAQKLVKAENELLTPQQQAIVFGLFGPGIDDKSPNPFMPQHPSVMMQEGVKVPYIIGYNSNEGSLLLTPFTSAESKTRLREINEDFSIVIPNETKLLLKKEDISPNDLKRLYFGNELVTEKTMQQYANFISDVMFLRGVYDVIDTQMEKATTPTYMYKFTYEADVSFAKQFLNIPLAGTTHADDLLYLFHAHLLGKIAVPPKGSIKYKVMKYFTTMWANFAKTGNPTPEITPLITTLWKPIKKSNEYNYLCIDSTLTMESIKKDERTSDWKKMKNKL